jgi:CheY-like chemotaxis protein
MERGPSNLACPYCGRPLRWVPFRWFNRGSYQCTTCGDFPDMTNQVAPATPPLHVPPTHGDRPRVLLVDDSKEHRDLYALMLESTATVITAARGPDALAIASSAHVDVIVLDVLMPIMNGWEVCARLKANPLTRRIPVIMLTSLDGSDASEPALRAGAAAVLMKPCPIERLAATIESVVTAQKLQADASTPSRRWKRKRVTTPMPAKASNRAAQVLNVSYGGVCLRIDAECRDMPSSFELTFPSTEASVRADVVWVNPYEQGACVCGLAVAAGNEAWRAFVDGMR